MTPAKVSPEKAEAIRRLHVEFKLGYKHIYKLIPLPPSPMVVWNCTLPVGVKLYTREEIK